MKTHLEQKWIAITGSTAGIGKGMARRFVEEGAHVVVNGRKESTVQAVVQELQALQRQNDHKAPSEHSLVKGVACDVTTEAGRAQFLNFIETELTGPLYALVNNMSLYERKPFAELTADDFRRLYDMNCVSSGLLAQRLLPRLLERNEGCLLWIASDAAYSPKEFMLHYCMTKAAQLNMARSLAELTKGSAVRVNVIAPGPTKTEGAEQFLQGFARDRGVPMAEAERTYIQEVEPTSLIQRFATVDEVASFAVFLCSPLASAMTGRTYLVDGGIIKHI